MNPILLAGIGIVNLALVFYSLFFFKKKTGFFTPAAVVFLGLGVVFDLTSTTLMIVGAHRGLITVHGFIGYTALGGMVSELVVVLRTFLGKKEITPRVRIMTRITYLWWVCAYLAGIVLVMGSRSHG